MNFDTITIPLALGIALLPTVILCGFFFWRFRCFLSRGLLVDALSLGVVAAIFSSCFGIVGLRLALHIDSTVWLAFYAAFVGAAIPEELAKLLVIWALLRHHEDCEWPQSIFAIGIIVGLGFAAFENVVYVFEDAERWLETGMVRGMMVVPMHTACGIVLGWFLARAHSRPRFRMFLLACGGGLAVFLHGVYDWPIFYLEQVGPKLAIVESAEIAIGKLGLIAAVTVTAIAAILAAPTDIETDFAQPANAEVRPRTARRRISHLEYGFVLAGSLLGLSGIAISLALVGQEILALDPYLHVPAFGFLPLAFGLIILLGMKNEADTARATSAS